MVIEYAEYKGQNNLASYIRVIPYSLKTNLQIRKKFNLIITRAIWKVTSGELSAKQAMRKKKYYIQKIHTCLSYIST
jgi:hypothetical protein